VTSGRGLGMLRLVVRSVLRGFFACALGSLVSSCSGGTETGNPTFQAELSYTAYSSAPLLIGLRELGSRAVVDNAWLDLDRVQLLGAGSCADANPPAASAPALGIGDHAAGQHNATRFALSEGEYCALNLPFVLASQDQIQDGVPDDLARHSIMLAGALADGTPFTLLSAKTATVRLLADAGSFEINAEQPQTLIAFDVAAWLADLDWSAAVRVDGTIRISANDNPALLAQFERQLSRGVALFRDADGDGKLDANAMRLATGE
jgi:hypothetical protein